MESVEARVTGLGRDPTIQESYQVNPGVLEPHPVGSRAFENASKALSIKTGKLYYR